MRGRPESTIPSMAPARLSDEDRLRLSGHPLLHELPADRRDELIDAFQTANVDEGQSLLEEGEANNRLFVVLRGSVSVKLPRRAARVSEVKLATLGAGEIFGEYSLFDGEPVSATVYAVEPSRVAWLEKPALDRFVDSHREVGRLFYETVARILVRRLREKNAELDLLTIG